MKPCCRCRIKKDLSEFIADKRRPDGKQSACRACLSIEKTARYWENPDKFRAKTNAYNRARAKERCEKQKAYYLTHKKEQEIRSKRWRLKNPAHLRFRCALRHAAKMRAVPAWANMGAIKAIYKEAKMRGLHVDHIAPLTSPLVCGLHVETNLQLLTPRQNIQKSNHFPWTPS